ncbi:MAG: DUF1080 domain-containing protein [Cyclobacteriaceae bacterium]
MQKHLIFKMAVAFYLSIGQAFLVTAQNQMDADRTTSTKIADLLNRLPTQDASSLEAAMQGIAELGEKGITEMASMLKPDGNNEKLEYALAGFAFYTSQPEREPLARMAVQAYGKALENLSDPESKNFVLSQLKWIGKEDATPFVEAYLQDERLSGTASRVLATIGSESSERALILALNSSQDEALKLNYIEALGDFNSPNAVEEITPYLSSSNPTIKKVSIYALANIADPSSAKALRQEAENANFTYEPLNASAMYLKYIEGLSQKGYEKQAIKSLKWLDKRTNVEDHAHTKGGVLRLMAAIHPDKAHKLLLKAASSEDDRYRGAALKYASDEGMINHLSDWEKTISGASPSIQSAIIRRMGQIKNVEVAKTIKPYLKSSDQEVRLSAIEAVVSAGENLALQDLLDVMDSANEEELVVLKRSLQSMGGENVTGAIASKIPSANDKAKVALLEVLASRAAEDQVDVVFGEVNNSNPEIKKAALEALSAMVTPQHLDKLVELLKNENQEASLEKIQDALIVANAQKNNPGTQTQWALDLIPQLDVEKQVYIYKVLSTTGGKEALDNLDRFFKSGSGIQKSEIVRALNQAEDPMAASVLLNIARSSETENLREEALKGYVKLVDASENKDEGKVIMLRNALELAKSNETIQATLAQLGNYPTFQALLVAGNHLDNPSYQQSAARAVMNIVLNIDEIHGEVVKGIVQKTKEVISGQDSQYYKTSLQKYLDEMPEGKGLTPLFNGQNLEGWQGMVANPLKRAAMNEKTLAREQQIADEVMEKGWTVEDELLIFTGEGQNIVTEEEYGDFEMYIDWKITEEGDAGIYLRGTPQVQIWDTARTEVGAEVGSGGLYNNQSHPSKPLVVADNPVGEWNTFHIIMKGEKVTVYLNGELVTDNVTLENYWDGTAPLFAEELIELQAHGTYVAYRDIYLKELKTEKFELSEEEKAEGFKVLFDGTNLDQWAGNKTDYVVEDGILAIYPDRGGSGNLMTKEEYEDFEFRFEFKLTPGANNGLGIRAPLTGDAAYAGMELQIIDNTAEIYSQLKDYQYHGSLYGVAPAKKGHQKPVGEWNYQEVIVKGDQVKVILNGTTILDVNFADARENGTLDGRDHPGLSKDKGHIGFLGHGDIVYFRNIRVNKL